MLYINLQVVFKKDYLGLSQLEKHLEFFIYSMHLNSTCMDFINLLQRSEIENAEIVLGLRLTKYFFVSHTLISDQNTNYTFDARFIEGLLFINF